MIAQALDLPAGYERFRAGEADVVVLSALGALVREALGDGTLYAYAEAHPRARPMTGRGIAYAVPLPDAATQVVVRRARHGGLLAQLTGDRFLSPRAPAELMTAVRLSAAKIRTPEVVAFATYPAGLLLRRSDVATREVPRSRDLAIALLGPPDADTKRGMLDATAELFAALTRAGARHPDLNLKNVLLTSAANGGFDAYVLDVDRIVFGPASDPRTTAANLRRFDRSARKWRELYGASIDDADLSWLAASVARRLA